MNERLIRMAQYSLKNDIYPVIVPVTFFDKKVKHNFTVFPAILYQRKQLLPIKI